MRIGVTYRYSEADRASMRKQSSWQSLKSDYDASFGIRTRPVRRGLPCFSKAIKANSVDCHRNPASCYFSCAFLSLKTRSARRFRERVHSLQFLRFSLGSEASRMPTSESDYVRHDEGSIRHNYRVGRGARLRSILLAHPSFGSANSFVQRFRSSLTRLRASADTCRVTANL